MFKLILGDCMKEMKNIKKDAIDLTLTDIPYEFANKETNGIRVFDKGDANKKTFDIVEFLDEVYRISKSNIIIFCGKEQFSIIHQYFNQKRGTVRQGVWVKSNPMPSNGQYVYLSGIENFVWFRKPGGTFNAYCKNPVLKHPNGSSKIHPTEKNHELLRELIRDNSNEGDVIFDPCFGSCSTGLVAIQEKRKFLGIEINEKYFQKGKERMDSDIQMNLLSM